jgi:hypothetical protein
MESTGRRLMFHGMVLFLLGLGTGFAEQHFANVRMGLAAHLEGLMNGIFLLALGALEGSTTIFSHRLGRILGYALWHLWELAHDHAGRGFRYCGPFSHHRSWT